MASTIMKKKRTFNELQKGDIIYNISNVTYSKLFVLYTIPSRFEIACREKRKGMESGELLYRFTPAEWECGIVRSEAGSWLVIPDEICNPGEVNCSSWDRKGLGINTNLYICKLRIPNHFSDDVLMEFELPYSIDGVLNIEDLSSMMLVAVNDLEKNNYRFTVKTPYKDISNPIIVEPMYSETGTKTMVFSFDREKLREYIKNIMNKRLNILLASIEKEEKASVRLQSQIDMM